MARPQSRRRQIAEILKVESAILSLFFWTASFVLWYQYAFTRRSLRQPEAGRVYPLNTHGITAYLTSDERFILYFLIVMGVVFFLLTASFYLYGKRFKGAPLGSREELL